MSNEVSATPVPTGTFPGVVPVLEDGLVRLRAMTTADLPALIEQGRDPETQRWTTVPSPYDREVAEDFLSAHAAGWAESAGTKFWAIEVLPHGGTQAVPFAGVIDLRPGTPEGSAWETGFSLHPDARGRGAMSSALRLAAAWAFEHGAPSLLWRAARGNFTSWRVARACGFTHHGTLPAHRVYRGRRVDDVWIASLVPDQPMTPRTPWTDAPVIRVAGLRLRPLRETDTALAEPHDHRPHDVPGQAVPTPETVDDWLLRRRESAAVGMSWTWCIADAATDDPLGEVLVFVRSSHLVEGGTAELGYTVRPSARGQGVAGRATRAVVEHVLTPVADGGLGLRRLVAETAADHEASNRILAGAGFTQWGREEAADAPDGSVGPALHWERLAQG